MEEEIYFIQDDYFIFEGTETISKIMFADVYHYSSDGEYTKFYDEMNIERRAKLRLCNVIIMVGIGLIAYSRFGIVNLDHYVDVLPLQAGRNKHDILLSNNVKLEIPVERLTPFKEAVNRYKFEKCTKLMFSR